MADEYGGWILIHPVCMNMWEVLSRIFIHHCRPNPNIALSDHWLKVPARIRKLHMGTGDCTTNTISGLPIRSPVLPSLLLSPWATHFTHLAWWCWSESPVVPVHGSLASIRLPQDRFGYLVACHYQLAALWTWLCAIQVQIIYYFTILHYPAYFILWCN